MERSSLGNKEQATPPQQLRPCGRLETYSTARHQLGFYNNVGLTATYTASSSIEASLQTSVFAALHHVVAAHPNLSAIPTHEEKSYPGVYFSSLPEIDSRTCVEFHTRQKPFPEDDEADGELDELLRKQHSRNFKDDTQSRPFWRLIIASTQKIPYSFTASWIFHHALSDGASSMLFHESFLAGLNTASPHESGPIIQTHPTVLVPSLEELHPMTISWSFFLRAVAGSLIPSYFAQGSQNLWTGCPIDATIQTSVPSYNNTVVISAETTRAFAMKCRNESTSVTAALSTLLAAVLFHIVRPYSELKVDTPISLRPFLSLHTNQMVNAITNHTFTFSRISDSEDFNMTDNFSWDTARQVKQALATEVDKKGADNPIALLKYVSDMPSYFVSKLGTPRDSSAEVSNLGVWRPQNLPVPEVEEPRWKLGRMTFSQSLNRTGSQISLSAVTGGDGCMVLSFNWPEEVVEHDIECGVNVLRVVPRMMKSGITALAKD